MGYLSDVTIAFAFKHKEQVDDVLAIYRMNHKVQKYNVGDAWQVHDWNDMWGLTYQAERVKWYDDYEDVAAVEHMLHVVQTFATERVDVSMETDPDGKQTIVHLFPYAYAKIRIGEDVKDIELDDGSNDYILEDAIWDRMSVRREIETNF